MSAALAFAARELRADRATPARWRASGGKWTFRASVTNAQGAKTQYTGVADSAADAVKQVLKQLN